MRTFATIKSHSIHPILIPFPIAFLTATVVCDAVGWWSGVAGWYQTGAWLSVAGIGTALLAAIPGFLDYLFSVPPNSSAKARATRHMIVNLASVGLFAGAWLLRPEGAASEPQLLLVTLEAAGLGLLMVG